MKFKCIAVLWAAASTKFLVCQHVEQVHRYSLTTLVATAVYGSRNAPIAGEESRQMVVEDCSRLA